MAIHDDNTVISAVGFTKEIDEAGLTMVLDNLQVKTTIKVSRII